jgi:peroxiredoxin
MKISRRLEVGSTVPPRELVTVTGERVAVPDPERLVHLQFRRFAGCPVCNLHLRSVVARHGEIVAAGVREIVLFHSPDAELRAHVPDLPFAVVADPDKHLYREFGVEAARRALLNPRAWGAGVRGTLRDLGPVLRGRRPAPAIRPHGGRFGLPADFLVAPAGHVLALRYGAHAYDQWPVDQLLAHATASPPAQA